MTSPAPAKALPQIVSSISCPRPPFLRGSRPRGAKAKGLAYERSLAKALPGSRHGQWFEYCRVGSPPAWCQTDVLLVWEGYIVILEAKYTWVPGASAKLHDLYLPVVAKASKKKVLGIVVCKRLIPECNEPVFHTLQAALVMARAGVIPVLQWLGKAPLTTQMAGHAKAPLDSSASYT